MKTAPPRASSPVATLPVVAGLLSTLAAVAASLVWDVQAAGAVLRPATLEVFVPGLGSPYAIAGLIIAGCATAVWWTSRRQRFGWALWAVAALWTLDGLTQSYASLAVTADEALPLAGPALWFLNRVGAAMPLSVAALLLIFPTGRFLTGWWGRVGVAAALSMVAAVVVTVVAPAPPPTPGALPAGLDPELLTLPIPSLDQVMAPAVAVTAAGFLVALVSSVVRFRRARGAERDRMRWLVWAVLVMVLVLVWTTVAGVNGYSELFIGVLGVLPVLAMTVGVVRPGVVPVEDLLVRTLVLGAVSLVLLAIDLVVVAVSAAAFGERLSSEQVVAAVLLLTVLAYGPLRVRLGALVHRRVYGGRADAYDVMAGLSARLESAEEGGEQLAAVARAVADAYGVSFVAVEVDREGGEILTATHGTRPGAVRTFPITFRGRPVGRLVLPARGVRSRLAAADQRLLADLVRQAATAARTSQLADRLQDSRERLVTAREEERRRIRRDLHDGLGPAMAGVVWQVETAKLLVDADPDRARATLTEATGRLQEVVADVRRLVHDLRPPALDDRGLAGALTQLAETLPVPVDLAADDLDDLPAAVEVATYRIVAEALHNAVRHGDPQQIVVRLAHDGDLLRVEVADDGTGIDPEAQAGVGLLSLRERAAELGGRTEVLCPPDGGTVVRAELPLRGPREPRGGQS